MDKYFFVLGRYPELAFSEIKSVLNKNNLVDTPELISPEIVVLSIPPTDLPELFHSLGGSIKFGKILGEADLSEDQSNFFKFFESKFLKEKIITSKVSKVHFGISIYDGQGSKEIIKKLENNLQQFQLKIKNNLKTVGIKSGFLRIKGKALSSVAVKKNNLLDKGFELILISCPQKLLIGKTIAVQDFNSFVARDIRRPKKDKKSGILPVKLARMMVNLSMTTSNQILFDPFCGSGTVLMEAALLGIKNLIASDISPRAISDTQENLDWLFKEYSLKKSEYNLKYQISDVRKLLIKLGKNVVDTIVTEPFLGPPFYRAPDLNIAAKFISELTSLYKESLVVFNSLLNKNGKIVMVFPVFQTKEKKLYIDKKIIRSTEFKILNSYLYSSPGHFVGREILTIVKVAP